MLSPLGWGFARFLGVPSFGSKVEVFVWGGLGGRLGMSSLLDLA